MESGIDFHMARSELVVEPFADGTFRYVSNTILSAEKEPEWYVSRLTEEQWRETK